MRKASEIPPAESLPVETWIDLETTDLAVGVRAATDGKGVEIVFDVVGGGEATVLTATLRSAGLTADRGYDNRSMKAQMKLANRSGASAAVIVGDDELTAGTVVVKPLRNDADQVTIPRDDLINFLTSHSTGTDQ